MSYPHMTCYILLLITILGINAQITIIRPDNLRDVFKDEDIPAVYANFGYIPYGQKVIGKLYYNP